MAFYWFLMDLSECELTKRERKKNSKRKMDFLADAYRSKYLSLVRVQLDDDDNQTYPMNRSHCEHSSPKFLNLFPRRTLKVKKVFFFPFLWLIRTIEKKKTWKIPTMSKWLHLFAVPSKATNRCRYNKTDKVPSMPIFLALASILCSSKTRRQ